jgi:hypothetical protein
VPSLLTDWAEVAVPVRAWRELAPAARRLTGMDLGRRWLTGDLAAAVAALYAEGARCVRLAEPVSLCAGADALAGRTLLLLRELTGRGVAVEWSARCADGCAADRRYAHLYPPAEVAGPGGEAVAADWWRGHVHGRCLYRRGPGFVEVRDRRTGSLEMLTVDEPAHLAVIGALTGPGSGGVPAAEVAEPVRTELAEARLVAEHGGWLWWLPTPAHRWPTPPMAV